jgi:hypothetical protein
MSVYVDDMRRAARLAGRPAKWSHLMADTSRELADFAAELGLHTAWLQHAGTHREHYDVTEAVRVRAILLGAQPISYPRGTGELLARKRQGWSQA